MSPTHETKRGEHTYNTRRKRSEVFDAFRNQNPHYSPYKPCTDCGLKNKKNKLVEPKTKRSLYIEVDQNTNTKAMYPRQQEPPMPTVEDIREDIQRAQNFTGDRSPEFLGFPNVSMRNSLPTESDSLDRKIASSVERAVAKSQQILTAQMTEMMNNLMANLQINRGRVVNNESAHRAENLVVNSGRGAIPRHVNGNTNRNPDRGNLNNADRPAYASNEQPNNSLNVSTSSRTIGSNEVHKWNLRFEKMSAKEFLNCVKIQWEVSGYTWEQVYYNFHYLLIGQKEKRWYYQYLNSNRQADWPDFSKAFNRRFGSYETDRQITTRMDQRKQGVNEPFLTFLEDMEHMNASLENPKSETELVEFLRDNVNCFMRPFIWMKYAVNLEEFINLCVEAEMQIKKDKFRTNYQGRVCEVQVPEDDYKSDEMVEAFSKPNHTKKESHEIECWNCDGKGHFSRDCPSDVRIIHCFRCGMKGVTTPNCPNCRQKGNDHRIAH